jgi:hypothetical protein
VVPWFGRRERGVRTSSLDSATDRRGLRGLSIFQNFQIQLKLVNSKHMLSITPKIFKFCMKLYWSIWNNFLNCTNITFPT